MAERFRGCILQKPQENWQPESSAAKRLNPRNGLCLNALHDKAFDWKLMWVEEDFTVRFAPGLHKSANGDDLSLGFEGRTL